MIGRKQPFHIHYHTLLAVTGNVDSMKTYSTSEWVQCLYSDVCVTKLTNPRRNLFTLVSQSAPTSPMMDTSTIAQPVAITR